MHRPAAREATRHCSRANAPCTRIGKPDAGPHPLVIAPAWLPCSGHRIVVMSAVASSLRHVTKNCWLRTACTRTRRRSSSPLAKLRDRCGSESARPRLILLDSEHSPQCAVSPSTGTCALCLVDEFCRQDAATYPPCRRSLHWDSIPATHMKSSFGLRPLSCSRPPGRPSSPRLRLPPIGARRQDP